MTCISHERDQLDILVSNICLGRINLGYHVFIDIKHIYAFLFPNCRIFLETDSMLSLKQLTELFYWIALTLRNVCEYKTRV